MFRYHRGETNEDYMEFIQYSRQSGRVFKLTITDRMAVRATRSNDNFCALIDQIFEEIIEEVDRS